MPASKIKQYVLGDGIGFVQDISVTEDGDLLVANAARTSFDKEHSEFCEEKDAKLLNFLAREKHFLPFRHPSLTLRLHVPLFILRQLAKHQVGMSLSEVSRRYVKDTPDYYIPKNFRTNPENVKQGSSNQTLEANALESAMFQYNKAMVVAFRAYEILLETGVCAEQARLVLPQCMYTTVVWTGTLLAWDHLYKLRTEEHAQKETREYAHKIGEICNMHFPHSWKALRNN